MSVRYNPLLLIRLEARRARIQRQVEKGELTAEQGRAAFSWFTSKVTSGTRRRDGEGSGMSKDIEKMGAIERTRLILEHEHKEKKERLLAETEHNGFLAKEIADQEAAIMDLRGSDNAALEGAHYVVRAVLLVAKLLFEILIRGGR